VDQIEYTLVRFEPTFFLVWFTHVCRNSRTWLFFIQLTHTLLIWFRPSLVFTYLAKLTYLALVSLIYPLSLNKIFCDDFVVHYKPWKWKTMTCPTLGIKGALELFWELVKNKCGGITLTFCWFDEYWGFDAL